MKVLKEANKSFDIEKGKCMKCNYRESLDEAKSIKEDVEKLTAGKLTRLVKNITGLNTLKTQPTSVRGFHTIGDGSFKVTKEGYDDFRIIFYRDKDMQKKVKDELLSRGYTVTDMGNDIVVDGYKSQNESKSIKEGMNWTNGEEEYEIDSTLASAPINSIIFIKKSYGGKNRTLKFEKVSTDKWDSLNKFNDRTGSYESDKSLKDKYIDGAIWKLEKSVDESRSIKESANTMIYLFPELTDEDLEMLKAYGLQFLGINHGAYGDEENWVVRGQEAALRRYADKYLGYELHPDYLYDEEDFAGDIIKESITNSPLSTAGPIPYAVKLLYEMNKFVLDVYDNESWLMNGVPDGEFEETTAEEAMKNYAEHDWLITDFEGNFSTEDFKDFLDTFKLCTISKSYNQAERARIIAEAEDLLKEYSTKIDECDKLEENADKDHAYSKEEVIAQLKQELPNLGNNGKIKYGFKSEAEAAEEFLSNHYAHVELDKVGSWFQIDYAELLKD